MAKKILIFLASGMLLIGFAKVVIGHTLTNTMPVMASVDAACNVATNALQFNTYNAFSGVKDAVTNIELNCSPGTKYNIYLGPGKSGHSADRYMVGITHGEKLHYNIYTDPAHMNIWKEKGEASNPNVDYIKGEVANAGLVKVNVYGEIPAAQKAREDKYSDDITVTVDYH